MNGDFFLAAHEHDESGAPLKGFQLNLGLVTTIVELAIPIVFEFDAADARVVADKAPGGCRGFAQVEINVLADRNGHREVFIVSEGRVVEELFIGQRLDSWGLGVRMGAMGWRRRNDVSWLRGGDGPRRR